MSAAFGRDFNDARREQGFVSQAHLDAFYAHHDHARECADCQRPGWYWSNGDASWQPTMGACAVAVSLFAAFRAAGAA